MRTFPLLTGPAPAAAGGSGSTTTSAAKTLQLANSPPTEVVPWRHADEVDDASTCPRHPARPGAADTGRPCVGRGQR
jgi:hypothetical protein